MIRSKFLFRCLQFGQDYRNRIISYSSDKGTRDCIILKSPYITYTNITSCTKSKSCFLETVCTVQGARRIWSEKNALEYKTKYDYLFLHLFMFSFHVMALDSNTINFLNSSIKKCTSKHKLPGSETSTKTLVLIQSIPGHRGNTLSRCLNPVPTACHI